MKNIEVVARFTEKGTIIPISIKINGKKIPVHSSGRSWTDEEKFHILIMLTTDTVKELIFDFNSMKWFIKDLGNRTHS